MSPAPGVRLLFAVRMSQHPWSAFIQAENRRLHRSGFWLLGDLELVDIADVIRTMLFLRNWAILRMHPGPLHSLANYEFCFLKLTMAFCKTLPNFPGWTPFSAAKHFPIFAKYPYQIRVSDQDWKINCNQLFVVFRQNCQNRPFKFAVINSQFTTWVRECAWFCWLYKLLLLIIDFLVD